MICYWHMDAVRCKRSFLTVSAVGFFFFFLCSFFSPLPPLFSFVFILGQFVFGGETASFMLEERID